MCWPDGVCAVKGHSSGAVQGQLTELKGQVRGATQSVFQRVISHEDTKGERGRKKGQREKRRGVMLKLCCSAPWAQAPFQEASVT